MLLIFKWLQTRCFSDLITELGIKGIHSCGGISASGINSNTANFTSNLLNFYKGLINLTLCI